MADDTVLSRQGDEVEKAMTNALDEVQSTLSLPTKDSSKKRAAWITVSLRALTFLWIRNGRS